MATTGRSARSWTILQEMKGIRRMKTLGNTESAVAVPVSVERAARAGIEACAANKEPDKGEDV